MSNKTYYDKRSDFFKEAFEAALPYDEYLKTGEEKHRARWLSYQITISPSEEDRLQNFNRKMNVLVMSGIWCGDCARQGPMLRKIELTSSVMSFRYFDNRKNPELQEELRLNGAEKVPVVITLSEDFFELGRFGDRHLSVYRRKAMRELGAACDPGIIPPPEDELAIETGEWIDYFERLQFMLRLSPMLRTRYGD